MRVLVEAEREVAEGVSRVASLFERTQHEVRDDALFRLANNFANEPLVMLRRDAQLSTGEGNFHAALAAMAVRIGAAGFGGSGDAAVAHGNFALMQVFDSQRIAESAGQLFEF